jgi:large subunit ribosomal protein L18
MKTRAERRNWRKKRIKKKVHGTDSKPRLSVFRSASHIYAQVVDDEAHKTIVAASTLSKEILTGEKADKTEMAKRVGVLVAQKCKENKIENVVFDRNGFVYHGRIKALADGARETGLKF